VTPASEPMVRQYRADAIMRDGSIATLYSQCSSPETALAMSREVWQGDGQEPVEIRVYRGTRARGKPVAMWRM
jgi:hypothetical protein